MCSCSPKIHSSAQTTSRSSWPVRLDTLCHPHSASAALPVVGTCIFSFSQSHRSHSLLLHHQSRLSTCCRSLPQDSIFSSELEGICPSRSKQPATRVRCSLTGYCCNLDLFIVRQPSKQRYEPHPSSHHRGRDQTYNRLNPRTEPSEILVSLSKATRLAPNLCIILNVSLFAHPNRSGSRTTTLGNSDCRELWSLPAC